MCGLICSIYVLDEWKCSGDCGGLYCRYGWLFGDLDEKWEEFKYYRECFVVWWSLLMIEYGWFICKKCFVIVGSCSFIIGVKLIISFN